MPLCEPSGLRSRSACRQGRRTGLPSLNKQDTASGWTGIGTGSDQQDTGEVALLGPGPSRVKALPEKDTHTEMGGEQTKDILFKTEPLKVQEPFISHTDKVR